MMTPEEIVRDKMMDRDYFSQWLGITIIDIKEGFCEVQMQVRKEMLNGFNIAHGGITFSLADSAFAFASNSFGEQAVSIETSISHVYKVVEGDVLTAKASLITKTRKLGIYHVEVMNQDDILVATFKGTVYHTGKEWND